MILNGLPWKRTEIVLSKEWWLRGPRGATPRPRSGAEAGGPHAPGAVAKRSYPTSEVRGSSQECHAAMVPEWLNLTQMTIISTTVGRNPLEEME